MLVEIFGCIITFTTVFILFPVVLFRFSVGNYRKTEMFNAMMPVKITKGQNTQLTNRVTFRIFPLTLSVALARSLDVLTDEQIMLPDSLVQASKILILLLNIIYHYHFLL